MNAEEYFAFLEATLNSYTPEETIRRLDSYSNHGPTIEEYLSSCDHFVSLWSDASESLIEAMGGEANVHVGSSCYFDFETANQYSIADAACNDDNYFDSHDSAFELAA